MMGQEDYMMTVNHFMNKSEVRILLICLNPSGALIPANTFPDAFKNKTIYFVKRQASGVEWGCLYNKVACFYFIFNILAKHMEVLMNEYCSSIRMLNC